MDLKSRLFAELRGGNERLSQAAVVQIAALGESVLSDLEEMLADSEEEGRWWAVRVLAEMDLPSSRDMIHSALDDEEESVRQCAVLALREHPQPETLSKLIEMLDTGETLTRRLVGDALIALGPQAVPSLLKTLESGSTRAQVEAARALAKIGDTRAVPALYRLLDADSALLSYWAEEGLERMGVGMVFFDPGTSG